MFGLAVLVAQGVAASDRAGDFDQMLPVPPLQRVVLLEDERVVASVNALPTVSV